MITWINITSEKDVDALNRRSHEVSCLIFKHSTRCPLSTVARMRIESDNNPPLDRLEYYYLDLIRYRQVSNYISTLYSVHHESPQILLIKDGECFYDDSHLDIKPEFIVQAL